MKTQIKLGAAAVSLFLLGLVSGQALAGQPHMQNALAALDTAQSELKAAEPDKGGHRGTAMQLVAQAKEEVRAGIRFAR
jgi:hypothetical protein